MGFIGGLMRKLGLGKTKASIIVIGLQNSGKTSIVGTLRPDKDESSEIVPTVGFAVDRFKVDRLHLTVMDMSGNSRYHQLWECYFKDVQGVIFVVDSADPTQMPEAQQVLTQTLEHSDLKGIPVLVLANKMDLAHALTQAEVAVKMQLETIKARPWQIAACSAKTKAGVQDGMKWLLDQVKRRQ